MLSLLASQISNPVWLARRQPSQLRRTNAESARFSRILLVGSCLTRPSLHFFRVCLHWRHRSVPRKITNLRGLLFIARKTARRVFTIRDVICTDYG